MNAITLPDHYTDTRKIELLASRGFDPEQISEILDLSVGRVERTIKTAASRAIDEHRARPPPAEPSTSIAPISSVKSNFRNWTSWSKRITPKQYSPQFMIPKGI
jgi:hypothetical protein